MGNLGSKTPKRQGWTELKNFNNCIYAVSGFTWQPFQPRQCFPAAHRCARTKQHGDL